MLHSLLSLKLAFMVAAAGLDTDDWDQPSADMVLQVQALETLQKATVEQKPAPPNGSLQDIVAKIQELADKKNDKDALFAMGLFSQQGLFTQQGNQQGAIELAKAYYRKASDAGQLQAMNNYGYIVAAGAQEAAAQKEGIGFIKQAAEKGLNAARRNMAAIYLRGMAGEPQNFDSAKKELETAAGKGDNQAEFELAQYYLGNGGETNQNDQTAYKWLETAANHGNPNALAALGSVLLDGKKFGKGLQVNANPKKAVELFQELGDKKGNAGGLRILGELHQVGRPDAGISKDFNKALEYYTKAASGNDPLALVILAQFHEGGFDADPKDSNKTPEVAANPAVALQLYRLAAQQNVPLAIFKIGLFYENGVAVDKDLTKAFAYYLQAAGSNVGIAMQKVGVFYLNGAGTLKDAIAATAWFSRGAQGQVPDSLVSLGIMAENGLVPPSQNSTAFQDAGRNYSLVESNPNASAAVRLEALLRLGALHYKGLMVGPTQTKPVPDFDKAYICFKLATEIDANNDAAKKFKEQAAKELTQDKISKGDGIVEEMKKNRKKVEEDAAAGVTAGPTPPPAAPPADTPPPANTGKKKGGTK